MNIKRGDTYPTLRATLTDASGTAISLVGAAVTLFMADDDGGVVIDGAVCSILNAAAGIVGYSWLPQDVDQIGHYQAEFHVVFIDGTEATFPNDSYIEVDIMEDLASGDPVAADLVYPRTKPTPDGGIAVLLINKTGAPTVKGEVVTVSTAVDLAVQKIVKDVPAPIGVFLESGVADGEEAWVVKDGIADVYFVGSTTRGHLARGFLTADGGSYVSGQALSEALPTSPFASDKHFYEIGHVLQSRTGAGLAKCILHFN